MHEPTACSRDVLWDRAAWGLVALHTVLLFSWWPLLPWFMDIYYHLNVMEGFRQAGGVVLHDFWEFAPLGRPHLYPPALHVALLSFDWMPFDVMTRARLVSIIPYPALLLTMWWAARQWFGSAAAYWVTLAGVLPFSYLLATCNTVAASWAMVWWLIGLIAVSRGAWLAAALAVALVCYTHLGTPWLLLIGWICLAFTDRSLRRPVLKSGALGLLVASPWLAHLWAHRGAMTPLDTFENQMLELPIALYALAAVGLIRGQRSSSGGRRIALSLAVGLLPLLIHYRYRFFSGQGLLGIILLAGLGASAVHRWLGDWIEPRHPSVARWVPAALTAALFATHPVAFMPQGARLAVADTSLSNLLSWSKATERSNWVTCYYPQFMDPLTDIITRETHPDELIGSPLPGTAGLLSALSGRATATGMLAEVHGNSETLPEALRHAHLIVWLKGEPLPGVPPLEALEQAWRLTPVAETEAAIILRNPQATTGRHVARAVVPLWAAQLLLGAMVGLIGVDLVRSRHCLYNTSLHPASLHGRQPAKGV